MNEQKVNKFCMLISYTKKYWALSWLFSGCYDNIKGRQLWLLLTEGFLSLANNMHKRKKNNTETQTAILETVIRLQHISIKALTSSTAFKASHTVLTNVTGSPYEHWCQLCSQTVSSHFSIKKDEIFTKQKHKVCALLTGQVHDGCFPLIFG